MQLALLNQHLEILDEMFTNTGECIRDLSFKSPIMLVFLRHFGCVFCKESLSDIAERKKSLEENGVQVVFVHMGDDATATDYFCKFNLDGAVAISDPDQRFYTIFGLQRGSFFQLYGLQTWIRGYQVKKEKGFQLEMAKKLGDSTQMPGIFIIQDGEIKDSFIHRHAAERPDYDQLMQCCAV